MTTTASSALANEARADRPPPGVVIIGPPQSRRVRACLATLQAHGWPTARVVSMLDVLHRRVHLTEVVKAGDVVRWESPGECVETERALLRWGAQMPGIEAGFPSISADELNLEGGELMPSAQWFNGFRHFWTQVEHQLGEAQPHRRTHHLPDLLTFFDKRQTANRWQSAGVPVPASLSLPAGADYGVLRQAMRESGLRRVFIKLAHGSSGSGVVAFEAASPAHLRAITTVERVTVPGAGSRLYNTRRLRTSTQERDIADLINDLMRCHPTQVEQWVPKARHQGRLFDLRIVVIAGKARHTLVREGRQVVTNLHLGNARGDIESVRALLGEPTWQLARDVAERGMASFPSSLYAGMDVIIDSRRQQALLLEANAFGDYHRGIVVDGYDTYMAQLVALLGSAVSASQLPATAGD